MKTNFQMSFFFFFCLNGILAFLTALAGAGGAQRQARGKGAPFQQCWVKELCLPPRPPASQMGWHGVRGSVPPAGDGGTPALLEASPWHRSPGEGPQLRSHCQIPVQMRQPRYGGAMGVSFLLHPPAPLHDHSCYSLPLFSSPFSADGFTGQIQAKGLQRGCS